MSVIGLWNQRSARIAARSGLTAIDVNAVLAFVHEVGEVQTALGLVAAEAGICLVPRSLERLRRDNVVYRLLDEEKAVSPIIMSTRKGDKSPEIALILRLIREIYRKEGIAFGA